MDFRRVAPVTVISGPLSLQLSGGVRRAVGFMRAFEPDIANMKPSMRNGTSE